MRSELYRTWNKCFNMNVFYAACFWEVKQDSQCKYRCPACNAYAPYCHLRHVRLYNILPHYLINGTVFEKKVTEHKMRDIIFSKNLSETFLILRRNQPYIWLKMHIPFHVVFNRNWIFSTVFLKILNHQSSLNLSGGGQVAPCGRTDRHDEANSRFWQLRECI